MVPLMNLLIIAIVFLVLYRRACVLSERRKDRSRFWWTLNRCRAGVAHEGDPGPWKNK